MLELVAVASLTCLATGLGAIPVFMLGPRARVIHPALLGLAAGVMTVAAIAGLLLPAFDEGNPGQIFIGAIAGVVFLVLVRARVSREKVIRNDLIGRSRRTSILVFAVLFAHSLPEGFAIGTAYASETAGLGGFVVIAIAVQNIPEGTSIAIPMSAAGYGAARQFWGAVATSIPQPIGAVVAFLLVEQITTLLPVSFGFAAAAMLALVALELAPDAWAGDRRLALIGGAVGVGAMLALSSALGV